MLVALPPSLPSQHISTFLAAIAELSTDTNNTTVYNGVFIIISSENIEKVFRIKGFLQNYKSRFSNQQNPEVKEYFIQFIKLFHQ